MVFVFLPQGLPLAVVAVPQVEVPVVRGKCVIRKLVALAVWFVSLIRQEPKVVSAEKSAIPNLQPPVARNRPVFQPIRPGPRVFACQVWVKGKPVTTRVVSVPAP